MTVSDLELRLPVLERRAAARSSVPAPKVLPPGYELAIDYRPASEAGGGVSGGGGPPAPTPVTRQRQERQARAAPQTTT